LRSLALISLLLALFALIFPIMVSVGNPIEMSENRQTDKSEIAAEEISDRESFDESTVIRLKRGESVIELTMAEYLTGVVGAEMPADFEHEALKAQAVAARTYTMYKMQADHSSNHPDADVCDDSACCKAYKDDEQLREKWGVSYAAYIEKMRNIVSSTDGEYLSYQNEPILAVFHSSSTGKTEASENVWGNALPYLVSVDSMEDGESVPQYESVVTISEANFRDTIKSGHADADFSGSADAWITDTKYSESGRLLTANIGGVTVTGTELRKLFDLRSTGVEISISDDGVVFSVTGYGHGVGMSQYGANAMAQNGSTYDEILSWYYTDTVLTNAD